MDKSLRELERQAAYEGSHAQELLDIHRFRVEGSPEFRNWDSKASEAYQNILTRIDAVFDYWTLLERRPWPYDTGITAVDFSYLFDQILKSSWLSDKVPEIYKIPLDNWLGEHWTAFGINGYDITANNGVIRLNLAFTPNDEDALDHTVSEIDDRLSYIEPDISSITSHGENIEESIWQVAVQVDSFIDEDYEYAEEELAIQFDATIDIEAYHMLTVLKDHDKPTTQKIIKQYKKLFLSQDE